LRALFPAHRLWTRQSMYFGGCHVVERDANGRFQAAADARRDGAAVVAGA